MREYQFTVVVEADALNPEMTVHAIEDFLDSGLHSSESIDVSFIGDRAGEPDA